jgi:K+-transporting ATPase c subunit
MKSEIAVSMQAAKLMLVFTLLLGGGYTLIMTGLAQLFFPMQAAGSLHWSEDHTVLYGSRLMGQPFAADNHLWGRSRTIKTINELIKHVNECDNSPWLKKWQDEKHEMLAEVLSNG